MKRSVPWPSFCASSLSSGRGWPSPSPSKVARGIPTATSPSQTLLQTLTASPDCVLHLLSLADLANLGRACQESREIVLDWALRHQEALLPCLVDAGPAQLSSGDFLYVEGRRGRPLSLETATMRHTFAAAAVLIKRLTVGLPVEKRLDAASKFLLRLRANAAPIWSQRFIRVRPSTVHLGSPVELPELPHQPEAEETLLSAISTFGMSLTAGWCRADRLKALECLLSNSGLSHDLQCFWAPEYNLGFNSPLEMRMRRRFRIFWEQVPSARRSLWLDLLLSHTCGNDLSRQARLLFLVFGPVKVFRYGELIPGGSIWIMWNEMADALDGNKESIKANFGPLAAAISKCYMRSQDGLYRLIQSIINLFSYVKMDPRNLASILLLSSPFVRQAFLCRQIVDDSTDLPALVAELLFQSARLGDLVEPRALHDLVGRAFAAPGLTCCLVSSLAEAVWAALAERVAEETEHQQKTRMMKVISEFGLRLMSLGYGEGQSRADDAEGDRGADQQGLEEGEVETMEE